MRPFVDSRLEDGRIRTGSYRSLTGMRSGAFIIAGPCGMDLRIIASEGDQEYRWEHVSVSLPKRCPNWVEMCFVKDLIFDPEETVMQLHPPQSQYVNNHNFCLHLWRPLDATIPMPPRECV